MLVSYSTHTRARIICTCSHTRNCAYVFACPVRAAMLVSYSTHTARAMCPHTRTTVRMSSHALCAHAPTLHVLACPVRARTRMPVRARTSIPCARVHQHALCAHAPTCPTMDFIRSIIFLCPIDQPTRTPVADKNFEMPSTNTV